jgi:hypothetical protein
VVSGEWGVGSKELRVKSGEWCKLEGGRWKGKGIGGKIYYNNNFEH